MPLLANLEKIKEISYNELLKSEVVCSLPDYPEIAKKQSNRLQITKNFSVGEHITATLHLYPMGISAQYNDILGLVLKLDSASLRNIEADLEVYIINSSTTLMIRPSYEYFEKKNFGVQWIMSNVAEASCLLNPANEMLYGNALKINIGIRIYNNVMAEKKVDQPPLKVSLRTAEFGDIAFDVRGTIFHAHRKVLEVKSPEFAELFRSSPDCSQFELNHVSVKEFESHLIDCYMNAYGTVRNHRKFDTARGF